MNNRKLIRAFALVVVIGSSAACGDDNSTATNNSGSDPISKAEFVTAANALCAAFAGEFEGGAQADVVTEEDQIAVISEIIVPELRTTLTAIRALGFPEGDAALVGGLIDQTNEQLDIVETDPAGFLAAAEDPFAEINAQLADYGVVTCGWVWDVVRDRA